MSIIIIKQVKLFYVLVFALALQLSSQGLQQVEVVSHSWQVTLITQLPQILAELAVLVGVIITGAKLRKGQADAAVTQKSIHTLVNGERGVSLRLAATLSRRLADITQDPVDVENAVQTKQAADSHDAAQKKA